MTDVVQIGKDEGLLGVESAGDDVLGVFVGESVTFFKRQALLKLGERKGREGGRVNKAVTV